MKFPAIEVCNLRKSFRKRNGFWKATRSWALDDVSFTVAQGETYGLLGPNGSGKSSLIRILSTLLIADEGKVWLMGHPLPEEQEHVRRIIGRVSYYPVEVLPKWLQPLSALSPATYTLSACRKLIGIGNPGSTQGHLVGAPLSSVTGELLVLALMGAVLMPLGLWVFGKVENWAKRNGKLKRTG